MGHRLILRKRGGLTLSAAPDFPPKRVGIIRKNKSKLNWGGGMGQRKKVRGFEPHLPSSYKNGKIIQKIQRALNF